MDFKNDEIILVLSIRTKITKTMFLSSILKNQAIIVRTKGKINWSNDTIKHPIKFDELKRNILSNESLDVAIVGGGIGGLSTAYLFWKSGKKILKYQYNLLIVIIHLSYFGINYLFNEFICF